VRCVGRLLTATAIAIGIALALIGAEEAGAYSLSLRLSDARFLSGPDMLAADAAGDMFVLKATRVRGGALSNAEAQVVELSPGGHQVRAFTTTFHSSGHTFYMGASGIAVTPSGGQVVVIGNASGTKATFIFRSTLKNSTFKCRLFRPGSPLALFVPCTSPTIYKHLAPGSYDFQVEAISHLGVAQRKPTSFPFNVA
jgi:hypothetical protein